MDPKGLEWRKDLSGDLRPDGSGPFAGLCNRLCIVVVTAGMRGRIAVKYGRTQLVSMVSRALHPLAKPTTSTQPHCRALLLFVGSLRFSMYTTLFCSAIVLKGVLSPSWTM